MLSSPRSRRARLTRPACTFRLRACRLPEPEWDFSLRGCSTVEKLRSSISAINATGAIQGTSALSGQTACIAKSITPGPTTQCSFEVGFTPSTNNFESAFVSVTDNAPGSPQILELRGLPSGPPSASISPASYDFGSQPENTSSDGQTIALSNTGGQPLTLSAFSIGGDEMRAVSRSVAMCLQRRDAGIRSWSLSVQVRPAQRSHCFARTGFSMDVTIRKCNSIQQQVPLNGAESPTQWPALRRLL